MRIDKYLWCVRLMKTRSISSETVQKEGVQVNGQVVKPSRSLKVDDEIAIRKLGIIRKYQVKDIPPSRVGAPKVLDYLLEITSDEEKEKARFLLLTRSLQRQVGTGRPTKKDRREIDRLTDPEANE